MELRRAQSIAPRESRVLFDLATLQDGTGRYDEAQTTLQQLSAVPEPVYHVLYGDYLFRRGKLAEAVSEYERLHSAFPGDRDARSRLVTAYLATGRRADAASIIDGALRKSSNDSDALVLRAGTYIEGGNLDGALADLNSAARQKRDSGKYHLFLAQVYRQRGELHMERQELEQALHIEPRLLGARLQLAHAFTTANAPKAAMAVLDVAAADQKETLPFLLERNAALFAQQRFTDVRRNLDSILTKSRNPAALLQDGLLRIAEKDYAGAQKQFTGLVTANPGDWRAVDALAQCYAAQSKLPEAVALVKEHTAGAPDSVEAQELLGRWLARIKDNAGARQALQRALTHASPSSKAELQTSLAELDLSDGNVSTAEARLRDALHADKSNMSLTFALAQLEQMKGQIPEATQLYETVVAANPGHTAALNNLSYLLIDSQKDVDRGLQLAQKALEADPDNPAINDTIGWGYYLKGLYRNAAEHLQKAAATSHRRKCHLAHAYIKLGETTKAAELLRVALQQDPSLPEVRSGLLLLNRGR